MHRMNKTPPRSLVLVAGLLFCFSTGTFAGDPEQGRKLAVQCQTCHGIDGLAKIPIAPNIAGESQIYLQSQLKAFRSGKREHEMMSVVAKNLTDRQIADLAAWYESIEVTVTLPD
ncbi:Cytochrome c553 [Marinobacter daqiaonensis]|uniref:Cytochrome c553 n=1 Tax=Marinobacter daqiaonensis TaxID=650891 RepID=A0A1I6HUJ4_9GAMM|nr:cytochrome c [Marinobacter daqiaonensis]SFR58106.1 Cytochrome c553 [Marinobacter daqiaonensis]